MLKFLKKAWLYRMLIMDDFYPGLLTRLYRRMTRPHKYHPIGMSRRQAARRAHEFALMLYPPPTKRRK